MLFYWREAERESSREWTVPRALTEDFSAFQRCMKGTNAKHFNRCAALKGRVGESVACSIYASRPSPCREFSASLENGVRSTRCDEARAAHGLEPLRRSDWAGLAVPELPPGTRPAIPGEIPAP